MQVFKIYESIKTLNETYDCYYKETLDFEEQVNYSHIFYQNATSFACKKCMSFLTSKSNDLSERLCV